MITTVLVHKGTEFFPYIDDCVDQFFLRNPGQKLVLLTDRPFIETEKLASKYPSFESLLSVDLPKSRNHAVFSKWNRMRHSTFRGGFWRFAIERFFALEDYLSFSEAESVLHFECDNAMYFKVQALEEAFLRTSRGISLPIDALGRAIPSVVFIKDRTAISRFCRTYNWLYLARKLTDMKALYAYSQREKKYCSTLPVLPSGYKNGRAEMRSRLGARTKKFELFDSDFDAFGGIFDAAAIGQFIGGVDPRNEPPYGPGFINETALYSPADLAIHWQRDSDGLLAPYGTCDGATYPIFNLHVHCKDLASFRSDTENPPPIPHAIEDEAAAAGGTR